MDVVRVGAAAVATSYMVISVPALAMGLVCFLLLEHEHRRPSLTT